MTENGKDAERRETLADIVAEIRAYGAQPPPRLMWLEIADRIEAAWKRENAEWKAAACACVSDAVMSGRVAVEHKPVGNAAAMYDALVKIAHYCDDKDGMDDPYCADWHILSDMARAALSAPMRNCDRFNTVLEAAKAFAAEYQKQPHPCPDFIFSRWLLAPAAERKGDENGR